MVHAPYNCPIETLCTVSSPTLMGCSGCSARPVILLDVSSTANPFRLSSWRISAQLSQLCVPKKTPMAGALRGVDPGTPESPPTTSLAILLATDPAKISPNHPLFSTGSLGLRSVTTTLHCVQVYVSVSRPVVVPVEMIASLTESWITRDCSRRR